MEMNFWLYIVDCLRLVLSLAVEANGLLADFDTIFTSFISRLFSPVGLIVFASFWGFNFTLWGAVGLVRLAQEYAAGRNFIRNFSGKTLPVRNNGRRLTAKDVAAIVPAHNEELVIAKTIASLLRLLPHENIFVISDGSVDETARIARSFRVNVFEITPCGGKANALDIGIRNFDLDKKYKAVLFVDADTVLREDYLDKALPYFSDSEVVAVAGYARTIWDASRQSFRQNYFIAHREIVYALSQRLMKYGQSWKYANVAMIIPGFASIYRASILKDINLNPPGLVIEDFNMTFEVHHKKLGRIVHHPDVSGFTQDPDNLHDYFRQVKRWDLGFWQTIRHHGFWPSKFTASLSFFVAEVLMSSLSVLTILLLFLVLLILTLATGFRPSFLASLELITTIIVLGFWLPSFIIGIAVALIQKRYKYLYFAPFFIFLRVLDSLAYLITLFKAFLIQSGGPWVSPSRR